MSVISKQDKSRWQSVWGFLTRIVHSVTSNDSRRLSISTIILAIIFVRWLYIKFKRRLFRFRQEKDYEDRTDFNVIQATLLSTEHLPELGRIEKRTLFVKNINDVFKNEVLLHEVLKAAQKTSSEQPVLPVFLSGENKWHVLNTVTNHLSSLFAPYHMFFNEARRDVSYYKSAWYAFTITCQQTNAAGRFFITPYNPVTGEDFGSLRIRIVLVNEQELRDIVTGVIAPPEWGFFNNRHEQRWRVMRHFADLFERQLTNVSGQEGMRTIDWGPNLCGRLYRRGSSVGRFAPESEASKDDISKDDPAEVPEVGAECDAEDNCFLRIHIPYPANVRGGSIEDCETKSRDVVLFE